MPSTGTDGRPLTSHCAKTDMTDIYDSYNPQSLFSLHGRIALVTGGGTGIGAMITRGFAAAGAKVYITGRRLNTLEKAASEWNQSGKGGQVIP